MQAKDYSENYLSGWVKLYRSLTKKGFYKKSDYVHLWIHILLKANHEPNEWIYKNQTMKVKRGQFITSRKSLCRETGIERNKLERILKHLESEQQIEQQNLFSSRLITIINYEQYQKYEQESEQPVSSERAASEQPVSTNKNDKNVKNEKKSIGAKKFSPPTPAEVSAYSKSINYDLDAQYFCDWYQTKNWMIGKNKMVDWQAAVRTWKRKDENQNGDSSKPKHVKGTDQQPIWMALGYESEKEYRSAQAEDIKKRRATYPEREEFISVGDAIKKSLS